MGQAALDSMTGYVDVTIPSDQREGNQASVHRWLKKVGEQVRKNEPLLEVNTDKVTLEIVAPVAGVLVEILKEPKATVELSDVFGRIATGDAAVVSAVASSTQRSEPRAGVAGDAAAVSDSSGSDGSGSDSSVSGPSAVSNSSGATGRQSPAVRTLAAQHGIDLSSVVGSGESGRITARDVEKLVQTQSRASRQIQPLSPAANPTLPNPKLRSATVPHTPMRKAIAAEMAKSVSTAPHVTSVFEVDFDAVLAHRAQTRELFARRGVKLTVTPYLVLASRCALEAVPEVNSSWHPEHLQLHGQMNIGIATALESAQGGGAGLVVPVVKDVARYTLFELAQELTRLTEVARGGKLTASDVSGGTFTISNHGVSGSLVASPIIILQPQVAILGVGKLERRMVVTEIQGREVFEARSRAYVTLTIDHRALDGFSANRFLTVFAEALSQEGLRALTVG